MKIFLHFLYAIRAEPIVILRTEKFGLTGHKHQQTQRTATGRFDLMDPARKAVITMNDD